LSGTDKYIAPLAGTVSQDTILTLTFQLMCCALSISFHRPPEGFLPSVMPQPRLLVSVNRVMSTGEWERG